MQNSDLPLPLQEGNDHQKAQRRWQWRRKHLAGFPGLKNTSRHISLSVFLFFSSANDGTQGLAHTLGKHSINKLHFLSFLWPLVCMLPLSIFLQVNLCFLLLILFHYSFTLLFYFFPDYLCFCSPGNWPMVLCMLGKCTTTELH